MGRIPEHLVNEVRERADIVQVVSGYITLKRSGARHWGLCPFHSEKTPSFQVHGDKQIFYCFGCGVGGDVFAFRMRHDGLSFPDAIRALAREFGVDLPVSTEEGHGSIAPLHAINDASAAYFRGKLRSPEGAPGRRYLSSRGIPEDLIERFQLGYAPTGWDGLIQHLDGKPSALQSAEAVGLIGKRQTSDGHYDRFRNRLIFPIAEPSGHIAGFGARALGDDTPKYLNSPESPTYKKGRVLFGLPLALDAIRKKNRVIVVEGYFDVIALHRAGLTEAVAPCGTAVTVDHARRLRRYAREVVLLFDGDDAGQKAAERSLPILLTEGVRVRAAFLPVGDDPDTLVERSGPEALRACVEAAVPLLDHLIERSLKTAGDHAWDTANVVEAVAPLLRVLVDAVERASYINTLAMRLNLPVKTLETAVQQSAGQPAHRAAVASPATQIPQKVDVDSIVQVLLCALATHPELLPMLDKLQQEWRPSGEAGELLDTLTTAIRGHGPQAISYLLSPAAEGISESLRDALSQIVGRGDVDTLITAERAIQDCVAQLGLRQLERKSRAITTRLESCNDPTELESLLEEKQQTLALRHQLQSQMEQV